MPTYNSSDVELVREFLREYCVPAVQARIPTAELYARLTVWARERKRWITKYAMVRAMVATGSHRVKSGPVRAVTGYAWKPVQE